FARRQGRALAREPERPHRRGHASRQRAGVLGAVPPRGLAGTSRRVVSVRSLRSADRRVQAVSTLTRVLDDVIAKYAGGEHELEAAAARGQFLEATGKVMDDEPGWDERMAAFLEWYALERKMEGLALRPIDRYRREGTLSAEDAEAAEALAASHWSLFQTLEIQPGIVHIEDLLRGGRFIVHERRKLAGIDAGDVFEGRLVSEG